MRIEIVLNVYNAMTQFQDPVSSDIKFAIDDLLAFGIEGAKYTPQFVNKGWDGRKHMYRKGKRMFPTGFLDNVVTKLYELGYQAKVVYKQTGQLSDKVIPIKLAPWPHQSKILTACAGNYRGLIQASTGSGKSYIEAAVCGMLNVPTVILTYRKELMYQLRDSFQEYLGTPVGIFGNGEWQYEKFNVCMVQSLIQLMDVNYSKLLMEYSSKDAATKDLISKNKSQLYLKLIVNTEAVILDECIPATQRIAVRGKSKRIATLYQRWKNKLPVNVLSFNAGADKFEYKRVTYMWKRPAKDILSIRYGRGDRINLRCTPEHKLLSARGWIEARKLTKKDFLVGHSVKSTPKCVAYSDMIGDQYQAILGSYFGSYKFLVTRKGLKINIHHYNVQYEYAAFKAKILSGDLFVKDMPDNRLNYVVHLSNKMLALTGITTSKCIADLDAVGVAVMLMEGGRDNRELKTFSATLARELSKSEVVRLRSKLDKILGTKCSAGTDLSSRLLTTKFVWSGKDYGKVYKFIANYAPKCLERIFGKATKKYKWNTTPTDKAFYQIFGITKSKKSKECLYDMEVKDNNNFVLTIDSGHRGIVAHNCHHLGASSSYALLQAMEKAYWRYGFSATAYGYRDDQRDFYIKAGIGNIIAKATTTDLVRSGHLVPTDILQVPFSHVGKRYPKGNYMEYYKSAVVTNDDRNKLIVDLAYNVFNHGKNVLIAVQSINHGKALATYLKYLVGDDNVEFVYGEDASQFRKTTLDKFKGKKLPILVSTLISEGVDIPHLEVVISARGEKSKIATIQLMGRSMRKFPGKVNATYIDVMDHGSTWLAKHSKIRKEIFNSEDVFTQYDVPKSNIRGFFNKYYG